MLARICLAITLIVPPSSPKVSKAFFLRAPSAVSIGRSSPGDSESRHAGTGACGDQKRARQTNLALRVLLPSEHPVKFETFLATIPARGRVRLHGPREIRRLPRPREMLARPRFANANFQSGR